MNNCVFIPRTMFDEPRFQSSKRRPWSAGFAWHWMVARAAPEPYSFRTYRLALELETGQLCVTYRQLCQTFSWSRNRVVRFLGQLEDRGWVSTSAHKVGRTIHLVVTICDFQGKYLLQDTPRHTHGDTNGHASDHTSNPARAGTPDLFEAR